MPVKDLRPNPHIMNKTAHLAIPSPYNLISQDKVNFRPSAGSGAVGSALTATEVLLCGHSA